MHSILSYAKSRPSHVLFRYRFVPLTIYLNISINKYISLDSVYFYEKIGEEVFKTGEFLGDLSDDMKSHGNCRIVKILAAGPKNYGYEIEINNDDGSKTTKVVRKLKGFTLNWKALEQASLTSLKDVIDRIKHSEVIDQPNQILRTKDLKIVTKNTKKTMNYTFDKRVRTNDNTYMTWPWGTVKNSPETIIPLPEDYRPW